MDKLKELKALYDSLVEEHGEEAAMKYMLTRAIAQTTVGNYAWAEAIKGGARRRTEVQSLTNLGYLLPNAVVYSQPPVKRPTHPAPERLQ